jgi:hypothetical protein
MRKARPDDAAAYAIGLLLLQIIGVITIMRTSPRPRKPYFTATSADPVIRFS